MSIISEEIYSYLWPGQKPSLQESNITLCTYSGEQLDVKLALEVDVQYEDQKAQLQLVVGTSQGPSLLNWTELCTNHACIIFSLLAGHPRQKFICVQSRVRYLEGCHSYNSVT